MNVDVLISLIFLFVRCQILIRIIPKKNSLEMFVHMYYCFFLPEEIFWEWNNVRKIMYDSVWVFGCYIVFKLLPCTCTNFTWTSIRKRSIYWNDLLRGFAKTLFFFGSRVVGDVLKYVCASTKPVWKRLDPRARGS